MKIFICWSEGRSHSLAIALRTYLPKFIRRLETADEPENLFVSDEIAKGVRWFDAVEEQLDTSDAGLVCVTREALQSGWIHFACQSRQEKGTEEACNRSFVYLFAWRRIQ
jgi:hypothetical protein